MHFYLWREMLSRNKCTPTCAAWGNTGSISTERLEMMAHFNSNLFGYNLIFALSGQLLEMCLSNYQYGFISPKPKFRFHVFFNSKTSLALLFHVLFYPLNIVGHIGVDSRYSDAAFRGSIADNARQVPEVVEVIRVEQWSSRITAAWVDPCQRMIEGIFET